MGKINPVGFDTEEEWALVTEEQFKSWKPHMYAFASENKDDETLKKFALLYLTYILVLLATAYSLPEVYNILF